MINNDSADRFIKDFFGIGSNEADEEDKKELEEIRKYLQRVKFENGQDICRINDDPDGLYFLESGTAAVLNAKGEQINLLHHGQYFGEYAVVFDEKRLSTVRSVGKTIALRIDTEDVQKIFRRHPKLYGEMMKKLYHQLTGKHRHTLTLSRMRRGIL